jgi:hypothetical protein
MDAVNTILVIASGLLVSVPFFITKDAFRQTKHNQQMTQGSKEQVIYGDFEEVDVSGYGAGRVFGGG